MKLQIMILLPLTLIAFLGITAVAILDPGQSGLSADELISESQMGPYLKPSDNRFAATPWQSREMQNNTTASIGPMPSSLSDGGAKSAKESRIAAEQTAAQQDAQAEATSSAPAAETPAETAPVETAPVTTPVATAPAYPAVSGSWSVTLTDSSSRDVVLTLFQKDDSIYGTGSMRTGNDTFQVAASGGVSSDRMILDMVSFGSIALYKADMALAGDSANGSYTAFGASGDTWTGSITGTRTIPQ